MNGILPHLRRPDCEFPPAELPATTIESLIHPWHCRQPEMEMARIGRRPNCPASVTAHSGVVASQGPNPAPSNRRRVYFVQSTKFVYGTSSKSTSAVGAGLAIARVLVLQHERTTRLDPFILMGARGTFVVDRWLSKSQSCFPPRTCRPGATTPPTPVRPRPPPLPGAAVYPVFYSMAPCLIALTQVVVEQLLVPANRREIVKS